MDDAIRYLASTYTLGPGYHDRSMTPLPPRREGTHRFLLRTRHWRQGNLSVEVELATGGTDPHRRLDMLGYLSSSPGRWVTWFNAALGIVAGIVLAATGHPVGFFVAAGGAFLGSTALYRAVNDVEEFLRELATALDGTVDVSGRSPSLQPT